MTNLIFRSTLVQYQFFSKFTKTQQKLLNENYTKSNKFLFKISKNGQRKYFKKSMIFQFFLTRRYGCLKQLNIAQLLFFEIVKIGWSWAKNY